MMIHKLSLLVLFAVSLAYVPFASAREWSDTTGKFRIEAELVTLRKGKAYLEKPDGATLSVPLEKLSKKDLAYLASLPEYREYFAENPTPGVDVESQMAYIEVDDESIVGEIRRFPKFGWGVKSLAFSPNGGYLAVGKMDRAIAVFDINKTLRVSFQDKLEGLDQVTVLAFTPDGRKLLSGGYRGRIQVWDFSSTGQIVEANRFVGHTKEVNAIAVSRDGQFVLSGGAEKRVRFWKLENGREQFVIDGFRGSVKATYITPSGKQGLACDGEVLVLIDLQKGEVLQKMELGTSYVAQTVAIAPDGSRVVVQDSYNLRMWGIRDGREYPALQDREIQWSAVFSPDGKYVISGGRGKINVWDVESSKKLHEFDSAGTGYVNPVAYSPDKRHISGIPGSAQQSLQVFRLPADLAQ